MFPGHPPRYFLPHVSFPPYLALPACGPVAGALPQPMPVPHTIYTQQTPKAEWSTGQIPPVLVEGSPFQLSLDPHGLFHEQFGGLPKSILTYRPPAEGMEGMPPNHAESRCSLAPYDVRQPEGEKRRGKDEGLELFSKPTAERTNEVAPCPKKRRKVGNPDFQRRIRAAQRGIDSRVRAAPNFLDARGYGSWTEELDETVVAERDMMHLLLAKLYNCRVEGRIIHEVYRNKQDWEPHFGMCDKYFTQLLTLARVAVFATRHSSPEEAYNTCYDLPVVYENTAGYLDQQWRESGMYSGCGGGRKLKKGAPRDFTHGVDYFKSRVRVLHFLETEQLKKS